MAKLRDEVSAQIHWEDPKRIAMTTRAFQCAARSTETSTWSDRIIPKRDASSLRSADVTGGQAEPGRRSHRNNPKHSGVVERSICRIRPPPDVAKQRDRVIPKRFAVPRPTYRDTTKHFVSEVVLLRNVPMRVAISERPPSVIEPPFSVFAGILRILPMQALRTLPTKFISERRIFVPERSVWIIPI
jgi:hypothetical protein